MENTYELRPHEEWSDEEKIKARLILITKLMEEVNEIAGNFTTERHKADKYLDYYTHRSVDEYWDSSSAEC